MPNWYPQVSRRIAEKVGMYDYSIGHGPTGLVKAESLEGALRYLSRGVKRADFPDTDPLCTLNVHVCVWSPQHHLATVVELPPIEPECNVGDHHWVGGSAVRLGYAMKCTDQCVGCDLKRHSYRFRADSNYVRYEA